MRYVFYYRHPRTQNEMKQYEASKTNDLGISIKIRNKRKPNKLPNSWDDIYRLGLRNWKYYRKTQWKE